MGPAGKTRSPIHHAFSAAFLKHQVNHDIGVIYHILVTSQIQLSTWTLNRFKVHTWSSERSSKVPMPETYVTAGKETHKVIRLGPQGPEDSPTPGVVGKALCRSLVRSLTGRWTSEPGCVSVLSATTKNALISLPPGRHNCNHGAITKHWLM